MVIHRLNFSLGGFDAGRGHMRLQNEMTLGAVMIRSCDVYAATSSNIVRSGELV